MAAHIAIVASGGAAAVAGKIKICSDDSDIQSLTDRLTEQLRERREFLWGVITGVCKVFQPGLWLCLWEITVK